MNINTVCPVCKFQLSNNEEVCPRCGFTLIGQTQAFKPVFTDNNEDKTSVRGPIPVLRIEKGPYKGEHFVLENNKTFSLGRDPECDIFLNNMTVSRHHASIYLTDTCVRIKDNGSLNGTWVNGSIVDEVVLTVGSHIQIGTFEMVFEYISQEE